MMRGPSVHGNHGKEPKKLITFFTLHRFFALLVYYTGKAFKHTRIPFRVIRLNHYFAAWKLPLRLLADIEAFCSVLIFLFGGSGGWYRSAI